MRIYIRGPIFFIYIASMFTSKNLHLTKTIPYYSNTNNGTVLWRTVALIHVLRDLCVFYHDSQQFLNLVFFGILHGLTLNMSICVSYRKRLLTLHIAGGKPGQAALIYTPFVFIAKSAKSPIRYNILPSPLSNYCRKVGPESCNRYSILPDVKSDIVWFYRFQVAMF